MLTGGKSMPALSQDRTGSSDPPQNRNRVRKVICRIGCAASTCPSAVEPYCVSTPEYCTMLNALLAVPRSSRLFVSCSGKTFESDKFTFWIPGPGIEKRDALPYSCPLMNVVENAAVLNQRSRWPPSAVSETPGTRFGRTEPCVPRSTSATDPEIYGVSGNPVATVK